MKALSLFISKAGTCAVLMKISPFRNFGFSISIGPAAQPLRDYDEEAGC
jgi:hypothetical protein